MSTKVLNAKMQSLPTLKQVTTPSVSDQVFEVLQQRILSLELPPRTKISEAAVADQMGVSRQPVRDAFKRLAKLGFLDILPQRRTTISLISEEAVLRARFIRSALEVQTIREACKKLNPSDMAAIAKMLNEQKAAIAVGDINRFHQLDEAFHLQIFAALKQKDPDLAADAMAKHLDGILAHISTLKAQNHDWFTSDL
ncbi:MAG: GntR family transcriptional regulator [Pseudomonadales bacterium]